jgi:hypothetical protein
LSLSFPFVFVVVVVFVFAFAFCLCLCLCKFSPLLTAELHLCATMEVKMGTYAIAIA